MFGVILFLVSVLMMGAGISYHSDAIVWIGFMALIWSLYLVGKVR